MNVFDEKEYEIIGSDYESVNTEEYDLILVAPGIKKTSVKSTYSRRIKCMRLNEWNISGCITEIRKYFKEKQ